MTRSFSIAALVLALAAQAGPVSAGPGSPGHNHGAFSAGAPGDPSKPARTVVITMKETDSKMAFNHDFVEVRRGEQIRFILKNVGALDHEFVLATAKENDKHSELMQKYPDMEHEDPNAKRLKPSRDGELLWRFDKRGEFEFACLIPGHREAGMHGKVVVK